MKPFIFSTSAAALDEHESKVVAVPAGLIDKDALLSWYAVALHFPEYVGKNWDALEECLRDLSWIVERKLVIYHGDVPLESNRKDQQTYLDVLATVVLDWASDEEHQVVVAFHPACELKLREVLGGE